MALVDLKELSTRESERVEWKDQVADPEDVVKTVVALANDIANLGGGYVVCGAAEYKDENGFQSVRYSGLTSSRLKTIEGRVLAACRDHVDPPLSPVLDELPLEDPERRVLVFIVAATGRAHSYRSSTGESKYFIRIGRETREARNGLLTELLVKRGDLEHWDRRVHSRATENDIDLLVLREHLQQMGLWDPKKALEDYLSPHNSLSSFVSPLTGSEKLTAAVRPRNFTLLLFSQEPNRLIPGSYTILSFYRGVDRSEPTAEKHEITGPLVEQYRKIQELLDAQSYIAFDKTDPKPNQVKYPKRALQEAVVNALVHRDYESSQPTRITVFSNRMEILSPGALPRAVDKQKFLAGRAAPYWRNQSLAYFFNKLQLAQAEGQGIPTIFRTMQEEGCPAPQFEFGEETVLCTLPAHPRHQLFRDLQKIENHIILGRYDEARGDLERMLEADPYNFRCLELYCETNNLAQTPARIYKFLTDKKLDLKLINPSVLVFIAESLLAQPTEAGMTTLAKEALEISKSGKLEANEAKKIAVNYRKLKNDQGAVEFLNEAFQKNPQLAAHSELLDIRAKAKMDLTKQCIATGRNHNVSPKMRARAWDEARKYLDEAQRDLSAALTYSGNEMQRQFIQNDMDFLKTMQDWVRRPLPTPGPSHGNKGKQGRNRKKGRQG